MLALSSTLVSLLNILDEQVQKEDLENGAPPVSQTPRLALRMPDITHSASSLSKDTTAADLDDHPPPPEVSETIFYLFQV